MVRIALSFIIFCMNSYAEALDCQHKMALTESKSYIVHCVTCFRPDIKRCCGFDDFSMLNKVLLYDRFRIEKLDNGKLHLVRDKEGSSIVAGYTKKIAGCIKSVIKKQELEIFAKELRELIPRIEKEIIETGTPEHFSKVWTCAFVDSIIAHISEPTPPLSARFPCGIRRRHRRKTEESDC